MPTSDRFAPREHQPGSEMPGDRAKPSNPTGGVPGGEPEQYFDPESPWDTESAEALTRLSESEEGHLWRRHEGDRVRRAPMPTGERLLRDESTESLFGDLEPRLAELIRRLQDTVAAFDTDKSLNSLDLRLDTLEEKLTEALTGLARRSDIDGLRLIEAQVTELAAHVEQTSNRLYRLDAMDEQMRGLAQKIDDAGLQRLDELERVLQGYVAEWRRSDERNSTTLGRLDEAVSRIGQTIDAAEAVKPATDLSLAGFAGEFPDAVRNDPLSQVYADGARVLAPKYDQFALDAADYAPRRPSQPAAMHLPEFDPAEELLEPVAASRTVPAADLRDVEPIRPPLLVETAHAPAHDEPAAPPIAPAAAPAAAPAPGELEPPSFRASAIRARLRQMQLADPESAATPETGDPAQSPPVPVAAAAARTRSVRPSLLLAAAVTLFAAAGYLLVDVFLSPHEHAPETKRLEHGAAPVDTGSVDLRYSDRASNGRIAAMGTALAAVLREAPDAPSPALYKSDAPPADDALPSLITSPPMTIGPASLRQAATNGDPAAQYEIGQRFTAGRGVSRDLSEALRWYTRAASRGLAAAQFRVAGMHERGLGVETDTEKARSWYLRAAQQGHVKAMHNLAVLSVGNGRTDYVTGAKWFAEAAGYGLADSQFNLAILHQNGLGVAKDLKLAYRWLSLAARGGDQEAGSRVQHLRSQLSPDDIRSIDAAIAGWRPRTPDAAANELASASIEDR